jgi:hypothetical protein
MNEILITTPFQVFLTVHGHAELAVIMPPTPTGFF